MSLKAWPVSRTSPSYQASKSAGASVAGAETSG